MELSLKPDFEESRLRYAAFWEQQIHDRPPVWITLPRKERVQPPRRSWTTHRERWLDVDVRAEQMAASLENRVYYADALPIAWPNMGPEIFSAWCGCGYIFGADTAWSEPCIHDWERDAGMAVFCPDHPLFRLTVRFAKRLVELGDGKFLVGLPDFHPGGDHLAALRDPERLAMDLIENPGHVRAKLESSAEEYMQVYNVFYRLLKEAGLPVTTWLPLIGEGRYYVPSNDFSALIGCEMFEDFFIPGLIEECRFYDQSIYHLDGPDALRHLDRILDIGELDAVQWVPGAGNEGFARWVEVYQRIQEAGKSLQLISLHVRELPLVFESLRPEGVWFSGISGIEDRETADRVLERIANWS